MAAAIVFIVMFAIYNVLLGLCLAKVHVLGREVSMLRTLSDAKAQSNGGAKASELSPAEILEMIGKLDG